MSEQYIDMKYHKMIDNKKVKKSILGIISTKAVKIFLTEASKVYDEVVLIKPSQITYTFPKGSNTPIIEYDGLSLNDFAMVFIWSRDWEDNQSVLFLIDMLTSIGCPICACRPKILGKLDRLLNEHVVGFETTSYVVASLLSGEKLCEKFNNNDFPLIIKPINGSGGDGIERIDDVLSLKDCLFKYFSKNSNPVILEPFFKIVKEWRVYLVDGHPISSYEKIQPKDSFKFNISQGGGFKKTTEEDENKIILYIKERLIKPYDLGFFGVDIGLKENGELYIIEYNMQAGWPIKEDIQGVTGINLVHELFKTLYKRSAIDDV